jgi:hypothetical protein
VKQPDRQDSIQDQTEHVEQTELAVMDEGSGDEVDRSDWVIVTRFSASDTIFCGNDRGT